MAKTVELKNTAPKGRPGKVHKVVHFDRYTNRAIEMSTFDGSPNYPLVGRFCEKYHNPLAPDGYFGLWEETDKPITCGNCLRNYWPDGRERV